MWTMSRVPASSFIKKVLELLRELTEIEHRVNMLYMKTERRRVLLEQLLEHVARGEQEKSN